MAEKSNIQWTDATWNIARGCTKVDADCKYCYMYRESLNSTRYDPLNVIRTKTVFNMPLKFKQQHSNVWHGRPLIFTSSLTDFFHEEIDSYRNEAWAIIKACPHLIFQILTKRPERIADHLPADWGDGYDNVWLGTSIGSQESIGRMVEMSNFKSKITFLSIEPMHGKIDFKKAFWKLPLPDNFEQLPEKQQKRITESEFMVLPIFDWIIIGGESGNEHGKYRYRPCEMEWIEEIVATGKLNSIPVFVKQMGTYLAKEMGMKDRHGGDINEFPEHLKVREFPRGAM